MMIALAPLLCCRRRCGQTAGQQAIFRVPGPEEHEGIVTRRFLEQRFGRDLAEGVLLVANELGGCQCWLVAVRRRDPGGDPGGRGIVKTSLATTDIRSLTEFGRCTTRNRNYSDSSGLWRDGERRLGSYFLRVKSFATLRDTIEPPARCRSPK